MIKIEDYELVAKLRNSGMKTPEITKLTGFDKIKIGNLTYKARCHGIKVINVIEVIQEKDRNIILQRYENGEFISDIARSMNYRVTAVSRVIVKYAKIRHICKRKWKIPRKSFNNKRFEGSKK